MVSSAINPFLKVWGTGDRSREGSGRGGRPLGHHQPGTPAVTSPSFSCPCTSWPLTSSARLATILISVGRRLLYENYYLCHFGTAYHHLWILSILFDIATRHRRTTGRRHPLSRQRPPSVPVRRTFDAHAVVPATPQHHVHIRHGHRAVFNAVQHARIDDHPAVELQRLIQRTSSIKISSDSLPPQRIMASFRRSGGTASRISASHVLRADTSRASISPANL